MGVTPSPQNPGQGKQGFKKKGKTHWDTAARSMPYKHLHGCDCRCETSKQLPPSLA